MGSGHHLQHILRLKAPIHLSEDVARYQHEIQNFLHIYFSIHPNSPIEGWQGLVNEDVKFHDSMQIRHLPIQLDWSYSQQMHDNNLLRILHPLPSLVPCWG